MFVTFVGWVSEKANSKTPLHYNEKKEHYEVWDQLKLMKKLINATEMHDNVMKTQGIIPKLVSKKESWTCQCHGFLFFNM